MASPTLSELASGPDAWAALVSLAALEIVLGVDNVIVIAILTARIEGARGRNVRRFGILLAGTLRIAFLFALTSLLGLSATVFTVAGNAFSWRDLILIAGGLFLLGKATHELHHQAHAGTVAEAMPPGPDGAGSRHASFPRLVAEIIAADLTFSIDSIITAIGMARDIRIMIAAVVIAVAVMYAAATAAAGFVAAHPTVKTLALAFLMLIGVALIADGFDFHIPRGYVYFAMAFAAAVEAFNILTAQRSRDDPRRGPRPGPVSGPPPQSLVRVPDRGEES